MSFFTRKFRAADKLTSTEVAILQAMADSGGGVVTVLMPTSGSVNSTNTVFGFAQQPNYIISDNAIMPPMDANSNTNWSYAAGNVTMTVAPQSVLLGVVITT